MPDANLRAVVVHAVEVHTGDSSGGALVAVLTEKQTVLSSVPDGVISVGGAR
ncbi:hypothetical protein [Saccharopolyspora hattusasensis]|uniref:hypothetical protein n=1 Tax=Saccharopolyspora hattusasensis TaxID=1128679 RepID=UPI003D96DAB7